MPSAADGLLRRVWRGYKAAVEGGGQVCYGGDHTTPAKGVNGWAQVLAPRRWTVHHEHT